MIVLRALVVCTVLIVITGHVAGQQPSPAPAGAPQAPDTQTTPQAPAGGQAQTALPTTGGAQPTTAPSGDVARGRYLVEQVAMCGECHSTRDSRGEVVSNLRFRGGPMPMMGPSWAGEDWPLHIPRIAGLPGYSDEQAIRLLTQGSINRDGRQLRPQMPHFRMTPQDAAAVVAYLRTR